MPCVSRVVAKQGFLLRRGEDEIQRFACLPQSSGNLLAYPEHDPQALDRGVLTYKRPTVAGWRTVWRKTSVDI